MILVSETCVLRVFRPSQFSVLPNLFYQTCVVHRFGGGKSCLATPERLVRWGRRPTTDPRQCSQGTHASYSTFRCRSCSHSCRGSQCSALPWRLCTLAVEQIERWQRTETAVLAAVCVDATMCAYLLYYISLCYLAPHAFDKETMNNSSGQLPTQRRPWSAVPNAARTRWSVFSKSYTGTHGERRPLLPRPVDVSSTPPVAYEQF